MEISYIIAKLIQFIHLPQIHNSDIDKTSKVRFNSLVVESKIGKYSYVAERTSVIHTDIGAFSSIAYDCLIGGASHPVKWISTSPVFHDAKSVLKKKFSRHPYEVYERTVIGNDVWIGANCTVIAGVRIADGAVLGAGSVLTKNIGPYEIWAGNPAKFIRKRFDDEDIEKLLEMQWWLFSDSEIEKIAVNINNPKEFLKDFNSER